MKIYNYQFSGKRVLITGVSGFKGAWLASAVRAMGAQVFGTVRNATRPDSAFNKLRLENKIETFAVDLAVYSDVQDLLNTVSPNIIFHLGAKSLVPEGFRNPLRTFQVNIGGTANVIEACRRLRVCDRLIIAGTDHVFGYGCRKSKEWTGFKENDPVGYGGPYDTSKAAMELVVRSYQSNFYDELPAIAITRCANVFGIGDTNHRRVVPLFVRSALETNEIPLKYLFNGRQFLHVVDAVAGYIRVAAYLSKEERQIRENGPTGLATPTFHFAIESYDDTTETFIRMQELARQTASLLQSSINDSNAVEFAPKEMKEMALDCTETKAGLNWHAHKTLKQGLLELSEYYRAVHDEGATNRMIKRDEEAIMTSVTAASPGETTMSLAH